MGENVNRFGVFLAIFLASFINIIFFPLLRSILVSLLVSPLYNTLPLNLLANFRCSHSIYPLKLILVIGETENSVTKTQFSQDADSH
jgi:hypothetical protein